TRRRWIAERREALQAAGRKMREEAKDRRPIHPAWVSACLAAARDPESAIVNEYTLLPAHCPSTRPGGFFGTSPAGGLGWGAGAGGYGERVEDPAELPAAFERAFHVVNVEKRQALLNVICQAGSAG